MDYEDPHPGFTEDMLAAQTPAERLAVVLPRGERRETFLALASAVENELKCDPGAERYHKELQTLALLTVMGWKLLSTPSVIAAELVGSYVVLQGLMDRRQYPSETHFQSDLLTRFRNSHPHLLAFDPMPSFER